ncbi:MAG: hypothetical protein ABIQ27_05215 [Flavobacterium sp.]|uniref:hypothetical protein n=1 Tax=Flavobacterium sp. TaxID=239 RepID=UPI0032645884
MKTKFLIACFILCCLSCKDNKEEISKKNFDTTLWKAKDEDDNYNYRDEMLEDLVYKVKLKGLTKKEVIAKLGEPDRINEDYLYYEVLAKEIGAFPLHKKFLVLKLAKDNTVEWRKIKD